MERDIKTKKAAIEPLLQTQREVTKKIEGQIYGSSLQTNPSLSTDKIMSILNNVLDNSNDVCDGDFLGAIERQYQNLNSKEREAFLKIKGALEDEQNNALVQSIYSNMNNVLSKYEDFKIIVKLIPQLGEAINVMRDSILSADDLTKRVSCNISVEGVDDQNGEYKKKIEDYIKEYKYDKLNKSIVSNTLIQGKHYVGVIPYAEAFNKYLDKKANRKGMISESLLSESDITEFTEDNKDEQWVKDLDDSIKEIINGIEVSDGMYLEDEILQEAVKKQKKLKTDSKKEDFEEYVKDILDGHIDTSNPSTAKSKKSEEVDVKGCMIKELDIRHLVPIKVGELCLGYYYVENQASSKILKQNSKLNSSLKNRTSIMNKSTSNVNDVENMYRGLSDLIVRKLDKKFIESNQQVKEYLYEILKYNNFTDNAIKITFLKPNQVVEFSTENGESILENVLFFTKLYLGLFISNIMLKISRSNDIRAFYLKTGLAPDVSSVVNFAINELKKDQKSLANMNHVPDLIATFSRFTDVFMPMADGEKPIDIDVIAGQDVNIKDDLLEMLEDIIVTGTGVPKLLIDSSNDVDFAKVASMLNTKHLRRVICNQMELDPSNTQLLRLVLMSELDDSYKSKIMGTTITYQSPMALALININDQVNTAKDTATNIASLILGDNNEDPKLFDKLVYKIAKDYAPNVDWAKYEKYKKESEMELISEKNQDGTDEMS